MCFSPEADLVGGVVISAIGIDVLRHRDGRIGHSALAALPLVFGIHQFVETFVWLGLQGHVNAGLGRIAMWIYLSIAFVFLPIFVPTAILSIEPSTRRRLYMAPFVVIGFAVAIILLVAMIRGPVGVRLAPHHLAYNLHVRYSAAVIVAYVVAVCGAWLASGYRLIAFYGIVNLVAVAVIAKLTVDGFASVWCGYAALTSALIAVYMRLPHVDRSRLLLAS